MRAGTPISLVPIHPEIYPAIYPAIQGAMQLILDTTTDPQNPTLKLVGIIGLADVENFDATLTGIVQTPEVARLVFDCSSLEAWDDSAIAALINFIRELDKEDRRVVLFGLQPSLIAMLDRMGITAMLPIFDTREQAIAAFTTA